MGTMLHWEEWNPVTDSTGKTGLWIMKILFWVFVAWSSFITCRKLTPLSLGLHWSDKGPLHLSLVPTAGEFNPKSVNSLLLPGGYGRSIQVKCEKLVKGAHLLGAGFCFLRDYRSKFFIFPNVPGCCPELTAVSCTDSSQWKHVEG